MRNFNKVRGILSAKVGTQIPKFQTPSGPIQLTGQNNFESRDGKYYVNEKEVTKEQYDYLLNKSQKNFDSQSNDLGLGGMVYSASKILQNKITNTEQPQVKPVTVQDVKQPETVQTVPTENYNSSPLNINTPNFNFETEKFEFKDQYPTLQLETPEINLVQNTPNSSNVNISSGDINLSTQTSGNTSSTPSNVVNAVTTTSPANAKIPETDFKGAANAPSVLKSQNATGTMQTVGAVADTARSLLFSKQQAKNSSLTQGLNTAYDATSSALMAFAPVGTIVGGAMKVGAFVGDALSAAGLGTDQMTTADKILDSNFFKLTPTGLINAAGAKKTQNFSINRDVLESVGGSYGGSINQFGKAESKAGKKYGLFSRNAMNKANRQINKARYQQNIMTDISEEASDQRAMINDLNYANYAMKQNGGYNQRLIRAAKHGSKLQDKIDFIKQKKSNFNSIINLDSKEIEWTPDIIEFKNWEPEIVEEYKQGGQILELQNQTPEIIEKWIPIIIDISKQETIVTEFKEGGSLETNEWQPTIINVEFLQQGGNIKPSFEEWFKEVEQKHKEFNKNWTPNEYDFKLAYETFPTEQLIAYSKDPKNNHLGSLHEIDNGDGTYNYKFIKLGKDSDEVWKQLSNYYLGQDEVKPWTHDLTFNDNENRYYFINKKWSNSKKKSESRNIDELIKEAKRQNPRFIQRMSEPLRYIRVNKKDDEGLDYYTTGTHEMAYRDGNVFSMIQDIDGKLKRFTDFDEAYKSALDNNNILRFNNPEEAKLFSESDVDEKGEFFGYKKGWPEFFKLNHLYIQPEVTINEWEGVKEYKDGGKTKENSDIPEIEETTQKNVIPEGALHKNKHHIEHTEGLTQKGIPVVDNEGVQQAEVECEEWTMTLELTKTIEKLYKQFYSEEVSQKEKDYFAISAGRILVEQILHNTDDRTGLIDKIKI